MHRKSKFIILALLALLTPRLALGDGGKQTPKNMQGAGIGILINADDTLQVRGTTLLNGPTATLALMDTTLSVSGRRVKKGSLLSDQWNCANPVFIGSSFRCDGSYDRFRALENNNSIHKTRTAQAVTDSGGRWPLRWQAQITTNSDSFVVWNRDTGQTFAVIRKQANGACGNHAFNDFDFKDGIVVIATAAAGVCEWDYLGDRIVRISSSGVRSHGNSQTRNSTAQDSSLIGATPTVTSNIINGINIVRDVFGKTDYLGRLAYWWGWAPGGSGYSGVFNPGTGLAYLHSSSATSGASYTNSIGWYGAVWNNQSTQDVIVATSIFRIDNATGAAMQDLSIGSDRTPAGSVSDISWAGTSQNLIKGMVLSDRGSSLAQTGAPIMTIVGDSGAVFKHLDIARTAFGGPLGMNIKLSTTGIGPPEFGICSFAGLAGDNITDHGALLNHLTAVGSPGFTAPSSSIVWSGAYSSVAAATYLKLWSGSDKGTRLTAGQSFIIQGCFKSANTTGPSAQTSLFQLNTTIAGPATKQVRIDLETNGSLFGNISDGATSDDADPSVDVVDGQWHHVALVREGTTSLKIYVDGLIAASKSSLSSTVALAVDSLTIGAVHGGGTAGTTRFDGKLAHWSYSKGYAPDAKVVAFLADNMLKSLQVEPTQRKLPAVDVDYVSAYDHYVVFGNQDSCRIWDARSGLPVSRYYASPGGNIQAATIDAAGPDSFSVSLVTTTKTQIVEPDVPIATLYAKGYYVQPAVGERVVIDSAGVRGIFLKGDDATLSAGVSDNGRAKRGNLFFCNGTYEPTLFNSTKQNIEGESWRAILGDAASTTTGVYGASVTGGYCTFRNISFQANATGTTYAMMLQSARNMITNCQFINGGNSLIGNYNSTACDENIISNNLFVAVTNYGVAIGNAATDNKIIGNMFICTAAGRGITGDGIVGRHSIIGNTIQTTTEAMHFYSGDANTLVVGNTTDAAITDGGVTSPTIANNDQY